MITLQLNYYWIIYSYLTALTTLVMSREFSECYNDVNICLWTNGSSLNQSEAERACQQRDNSFLPRITNSNLQHKLQQFRSDSNLLGGGAFWIDVKIVSISSFHWIDGSSLAVGGEVRNQQDKWARCAVIRYDINNRQFVFSARRWHSAVSSYICQLQQGATCAADDLSMNSKCYRKFHNSSSLTWFSASNDCLSHGGSLAVFTNIGRPSDNSQLTSWLNTDKSYWIGLVRSWWKTSNERGHSLDVQYSNWERGQPSNDAGRRCVIITQHNYWKSWICTDRQRFVCQSRPATTTATTTTRSLYVSSTNPTSVTSSTSERISTSHAVRPSSSQPAVSLDVIIGVTVGVVVPCVSITICFIAVLVYRHKNKHRDSNERSAAPATDDYAMLDTQTQGQQPVYNVIQPDKRHQNHNYENAAAAAAAAAQR